MKFSLKLVGDRSAAPVLKRPPWKKAVVFVCRKCSGNDDGDLRRWLKRRAKEDGRKHDFRIVSTGCLDVCPKRRVTVVIAPLDGASKTCVVGEDEREALYRDELAAPSDR